MTEPAPIDLLAERVELFDPRALKAYPQNSRAHSPEQIEDLRAAFRFYGFTMPLLIQPDRTTIIAGHARNDAAVLEEMPQVPGIVAEGWSPEKIRAYVIWDNASAAQSTWNLDALRSEVGDLERSGFDMRLVGFDLPALEGLSLDLGLPGGGSQEGGGQERNRGAGSLAERFGIPPFSVLNAREGWWQDRKRAWISLGIKSELGRGEGSTYDTEQITEPGLNYYRNRAQQGAAGHVTSGAGLTVGISPRPYNASGRAPGATKGRAKAKAFADGTVKGAGRGGLADQLAGSLKGSGE